MLRNRGRVWIFILFVTIFPETRKAVVHQETATNHQIISTREKHHRITRQLLNLVDLPIRPHNFGNESLKVERTASRYMYDIFENTIDKRQEQNYNLSARDLNMIDKSDIIMSYTAFLYHNDTTDLWFDLSITPKVDYVIYAELRLHPNPLDKNYRILLHGILSSAIKNKKQLRFIGSADVNDEEGRGKGGWVRFNVTEILQDWLRYPKYNHGLRLSVDHVDEKTRRIGDFVGDKRTTAEHPFIVAYYSSFEVSNERLTARTRWKRDIYPNVNYLDNPYSGYVDSGSSSSSKQSSGSCKLQKLYVRFRDLEFSNFIVAPEGYEAQYCIGECRFPLNAHMNATNHAIVQTLVHFLSPEKAPKICCAPRELTHLTVLYSKDGVNHMLKRYRNMIVKSCGCH